jgi:hypothetical protein
MVARRDELSADTVFSFRFAPLVTRYARSLGRITPQFTIAVNSLEVNLKYLAPNSRIRVSKTVGTGFGAREVSADGPCRA